MANKCTNIMVTRKTRCTKWFICLLRRRHWCNSVVGEATGWRTWNIGRSGTSPPILLTPWWKAGMITTIYLIGYAEMITPFFTVASMLLLLDEELKVEKKITLTTAATAAASTLPPLSRILLVLNMLACLANTQQQTYAVVAQPCTKSPTTSSSSSKLLVCCWQYLFARWFIARNPSSTFARSLNFHMRPNIILLRRNATFCTN